LEAESDAEKRLWIRALENVSRTQKITVFTLQGRETTTFSDWVFKSGGKTNADFKRRWCVIKGNIFYYYVNQQDTIPKGFWDLRDCELGRIKSDGSTRFKWKVTLKEVSSTKDERILYTDTSDKRERWLKIFLSSAKVVLTINEKVSANRQVVQDQYALNEKKT